MVVQTLIKKKKKTGKDNISIMYIYILMFYSVTWILSKSWSISCLLSNMALQPLLGCQADIDGALYVPKADAVHKPNTQKEESEVIDICEQNFAQFKKQIFHGLKIHVIIRAFKLCITYKNVVLTVCSQTPGI